MRKNKFKKFKVVKALIFHKGKFLLLRKEDFVGGEWEIPGGRKLPGEKDEEALKREVFEETGLRIKILRKLNQWKVKIKEKSLLLEGKTYLCKKEKGRIKLSKEHQEYKWLSKKEIKNLKIPLWLKNSLTKLSRSLR